MIEILNKVKEFSDATNHKSSSEITIPRFDTCELRFKLMAEENQEYLHACADRNMIEVADALGDMLYVLAGTILAHGMQDKVIEVFDEIHRSNMSKLDENGKPIYREDGKVLKGDNYFKPNISSIINGR